MLQRMIEQHFFFKPPFFFFLFFFPPQENEEPESRADCFLKVFLLFVFTRSTEMRGLPLSQSGRDLKSNIEMIQNVADKHALT